MTSLRALERYARGARRARAGARCELCALAIAEQHRHVVDCTLQKLLCVCVACTLAFSGKKQGRFRTVPDRVRVDPSWTLDDARLHALGVPVGLAFFVRQSSTGRWMAVFPSPAGPTEAELDDGAWDAFAGDAALVHGIEEDVEALLVRRTRDGRCACFVVPVDVCYELTALLRTGWRGIDGGNEAREALEAFVARLAERAEVAP
ncbi:MAG: hypothetical protein JWP87_2499 [Labilithrix sp.]|nr:hypothetical protein [Labilithrix sp.]